MQRIYFADTLDAALAKARRELGPEALLVEAGPSGPSEQQRGAFRVVCAGAGEEEPDGGQPAAIPPARPGAEVLHAVQGVASRLERLERMMELLARTVQAAALPPEASHLHAELAAHDFSGSLIHELLAQVIRRTQGSTGKYGMLAAREVLAEEICRRIQFQSGLTGRAPVIAVLAGPPGAGKTSALVKLAMREGVARRRATAIISTDGFRVAASEQLRTYATILGLPFTVAETPDGLRQAIASNAARDLILVDTPGFSRGDSDWAAEWASLLREIPGAVCHLVLPANLRTAELIETLRWWSVFSPSALIFTRLDETDRIGAWVTAAVESSLAVAYFSTGQKIPEDLEPASAARIRAAFGLGSGAAAPGSAMARAGGMA